MQTEMQAKVAKIVKRFYSSGVRPVRGHLLRRHVLGPAQWMGETIGIDALGVFLLNGAIFTVSILFVGSFLGVGSAFAKKARKAEGWAVPTAFGAAVMLLSAGISFNAGIQSGLAFYLGPAPAILSEAVGVIGAVKSANAFTQILVGVGGAALSFVGTFAAKDADDDDDEVEEVVLVEIDEEESVA